MRLEFAKDLTAMLMLKKRIIYIDQSSWNLWDKHQIAKTWQHHDNPIRHEINTTRLKNVTIYGACSNFLDQLVFELHPTTDKNALKHFLLTLQSKIEEKHLPTPITLVLDNHPSHYAHQVRPYYENTFNLMFTPPYSSFFNSQETVWSAVKAALNKYFARHSREIKTQSAFEGEVDFVLD